MKGLKFLTGAILGAATALLFAPKTGAETRALVAAKAGEVADAAPEPIQHAAEVARAKVASVVPAEDAKPDADDIKAKINAARDRIAEQITRNKEEAKTVEADVADVAEEIAEEAAEAPAEEAAAEEAAPAEEA